MSILQPSLRKVIPGRMSKPHRSQVGFTLIEVMVAVSIIAIIAAIAVPSYRRYAIHNAELQAQSHMRQLSIELERWRSSALSFRNFHPSRCSTNPVTGNTDPPPYATCYDNAGKTELYVPVGSTSSNYRYKITLTTRAAQSLTTTNTDNTADIAVGRDWMMVAQPNAGLTGASLFYIDNTGVSCRTNDTTQTLALLQTNHNCGTQSQPW